MRRPNAWLNIGAHCLNNSFYLELQRVGKPEEERYIAAAVDLALATGFACGCNQ